MKEDETVGFRKQAPQQDRQKVPQMKGKEILDDSSVGRPGEQFIPTGVREHRVLRAMSLGRLILQSTSVLEKRYTPGAKGWWII